LAASDGVAPGRRAERSKHLRNAERLPEITIGAGLHRFHTFFRTHHDERDLGERSDLLARFDDGSIGHVLVEQHQLVPPGAAEKKRLLVAVNGGNLVAFGCEHHAERARKSRIMRRN
jgi:hypothetical protein